MTHRAATDALPLTSEELAAIRKRCDKATPGPWSREKPPYVDGWPQGSVIGGTVGRQTIYTHHVGGGTYPSNDAYFIAAARTDVERLLATIADRDRTITRLAAIEARAKEQMAYHEVCSSETISTAYYTAKHILEGSPE